MNQLSEKATWEEIMAAFGHIRTYPGPADVADNTMVCVEEATIGKDSIWIRYYTINEQGGWDVQFAYREFNQSTFQQMVIHAINEFLAHI